MGSTRKPFFHGLASGNVTSCTSLPESTIKHLNFHPAVASVSSPAKASQRYSTTFLRDFIGFRLKAWLANLHIHGNKLFRNEGIP
jgi:hypothetical protein